MKVTGKHEFDSIPLVNSTDKLTGIIETTSAPTSASDSTAGYYRGYRWVDTSTGLTYVCVDDTAGAAVWTDYGSQINTINNTLAGITPQNELISGGVVYSGTGFVYNTTSLVYRIGGVQYTAAAAAPAFTLSASDPTNDRIDLVYVNTAGTVAVKTGTPAAAPARPTLDDPATELIVTFITVAAGSSNPGTGFENIYLEDTEWTVGGTGTITSNATSNPDTGTYHVDASLLANNSGTSQTLTFTRASDYTLPTDLTAASLNFKIKLDNIIPFPYEWRIVWKDASSNNVSQYITYQNIFWGGGSLYGIDLTDTSGYQQASIPLNVFNFTATTVRSLQIQFRRFGTFLWGLSSTSYSFDIDEVKIEEGGTAPVINTYVTTDGNATGDGTIGQVAIWDGSNNIIGDSSITYVISPGTKVGIDLSDSSDESRATYEAGSAQVVSDNYAATMRINSYSSAAVQPELHGAILQLRRGRGTESTPAKVVNGDQVGVVDVYGFHNGGGVAVGEAVVGQIAFVANDTFADSNNIGTLFQITTAKNDGAGSFTASYRITPEGYHRFYDNVSVATGVNPSARLHIASSTTTLPHIAFNSGLDVTSPSNGALWWNGTNLNFRSGGVTTDLLAGGGGGGGISAGGNATMQLWRYQVDASVDKLAATNPIYSDSDVAFGWDSSSLGDIEMRLNTAPSTGTFDCICWETDGTSTGNSLSSTGSTVDLNTSFGSTERAVIFCMASDDTTYPSYEMIWYMSSYSANMEVVVKKYEGLD